LAACNPASIPVEGNGSRLALQVSASIENLYYSVANVTPGTWYAVLPNVAGLLFWNSATAATPIAAAAGNIIYSALSQSGTGVFTGEYKEYVGTPFTSTAQPALQEISTGSTSVAEPLPSYDLIAQATVPSSAAVAKTLESTATTDAGTVTFNVGPSEDREVVKGIATKEGKRSNKLLAFDLNVGGPYTISNETLKDEGVALNSISMTYFRLSKVSISFKPKNSAFHHYKWVQLVSPTIITGTLDSNNVPTTAIDASKLAFRPDVAALNLTSVDILDIQYPDQHWLEGQTVLTMKDDPAIGPDLGAQPTPIPGGGGYTFSPKLTAQGALDRAYLTKVNSLNAGQKYFQAHIFKTHLYDIGNGQQKDLGYFYWAQVSIFSLDANGHVSYTNAIYSVTVNAQKQIVFGPITSSSPAWSAPGS
jgi:hypothetical protein